MMRVPNSWKVNLIAAGVLLLIVAGCWHYCDQQQVFAYPAIRQEHTLILDAGHGGEDGGAVSITGTKESQINLEIALKAEQMCGFYGIPTNMLRSDDVSLKDSTAETLAEMKRTDLKNRVRQIEETPNGVLISIHQNFYSGSKNQGAQVFFAPTSESEAWSVHTQELLRSNLNPENKRKNKPIPGSIYLMNHISCPAILIECGFISSPEEAKKLEDKIYQAKIAATMLSSYMTYSFDGTEVQTNESKNIILLHGMR